MTFRCDDARPLIPSYLDGELSEAQAAPLRKHLLDCQPCRASAQGEKNLKRWFVPTEEVAVPAGFAARVARRAFAGDPGSAEFDDTLVPASPPEQAETGKLLTFVLRATAVAAVFLVLLSVGIGRLRLPDQNTISATNAEEVSLEQALDELERLNEDQASDDQGAGRGPEDADGR